MDEMVTDTNRKASPVLLTLLSMSEQRGRRALEIGPTGQTVAANLAVFRKRRDLTSRQLSAKLGEAGRPIPASGITRMERGERHVTADELVALAAVLNVTVSALLLPLDDDPAHAVPVTGAGDVPADDAWDWMDGRRPLHLPERDTDTAMLEHMLWCRPPRRRRPRGFSRGERTPEQLASARRGAERIAEMSGQEPGANTLETLKALDDEAWEEG